MNVTNVLTKTTGVVGLGLIGYDSHVAGKINSSSYQKQCMANSVTSAYENTMKSDNPSVLQSKVKTAYFNYKLEDNLSSFFTGIGGYAKGFGSMLVGNIVPLTLSLGAVLTSPKIFIKKGVTQSHVALKSFVSKACAVGLLAYGGIFLIQNVLGIGKPKHLSKDF